MDGDGRTARIEYQRRETSDCGCLSFYAPRLTPSPVWRGLSNVCFLKAASKREQCQTCLSIAEREQARPKGQGGGIGAGGDGHLLDRRRERDVRVRRRQNGDGTLRKDCRRCKRIHSWSWWFRGFCHVGTDKTMNAPCIIAVPRLAGDSKRGAGAAVYSDGLRRLV